MDLNGTRIYGKIIIIGKNWEHGNTFKLLYHTQNKLAKQEKIRYRELSGWKLL